MLCPPGLGGTYSGNPVSCAAALAVIDVIEEERLLERSLQLGNRMMRRLEAMQDQNSCVANVRGLGAMVAFDVVTSDRTQPDAQRTTSVIQAAADRGLIVLGCGTYGNVIRILVPLTASDSIIDEGLEVLRVAIACTSAAGSNAEQVLVQS